MATDLIGYGSNAPNVLTTRPADTRTFGPVDTWGKDCSSPGAGDGTGILAGFMNGLLGQVRALIRGNGQTAALSDIIPVNNADDTMALRAIQQLIQRGQTRFGVDNGAASALVVAMSPALVEYKAGVSLKVLVAHDGPGGATTINVSGLGNANIVRKGGGALQPKDMIGGAMSTLDYDGTNFELADIPANYSHGGIIVYASGALNLTLQQTSVALSRTSAPAAMPISLPANAENGHTVVIEDVADNMGQFKVTVGLQGSGESICGASTYILNRNNQSCTFRLYADGTSRIWSHSS